MTMWRTGRDARKKTILIVRQPLLLYDRTVAVRPKRSLLHTAHTMQTLLLGYNTIAFDIFQVRLVSYGTLYEWEPS